MMIYPTRDLRPNPVLIEAESPTGLLVCLHGFTESPKKMADYTQFNKKFANAIKCNIIFLGAEFYWTRYKSESKDTAYILDTIISHLMNTHNSDRVYIVGFSAGACLVNTLVRYYGNKIDKAISYAGLINDHSLLSKTKTKVLVLNNTNDKLVNINKAYEIRNLYKASGVDVRIATGYGQKRLGHWWDVSLNEKIERFLNE